MVCSGIGGTTKSINAYIQTRSILNLTVHDILHKVKPRTQKQTVVKQMRVVLLAYTPLAEIIANIFHATPKFVFAIWKLIPNFCDFGEHPKDMRPPPFFCDV
jgi:hypothetical protein